MSQTKFLWICTDGSQIAEQAFLTEQEAIERQKSANEATDGTWWWAKACDLPVADYARPDPPGDDFSLLQAATDILESWDGAMSDRGVPDAYSEFGHDMSDYLAENLRQAIHELQNRKIRP